MKLIADRRIKGISLEDIEGISFEKTNSLIYHLTKVIYHGIKSIEEYKKQSE